MATLVTRTLETNRERIIATFLLALAIPCSAQLGVILAILSINGVALLLWGGVVFAIFLITGFLAAKIIPGKKAAFYIEIPPLRLPNPVNVITKTYTRMQWYFLEIFPIFILASILIWIGQITGVFDIVVRALEPLVVLVGLPKETAIIFLFGFFRRDYGAAGLYDLTQTGLLSGVQLVVASVTLTLFLPCIAQLMVMMKERGAKIAVGITAFIFPFAFAIGGVLNFVLVRLGVRI